MKFTIHIFILFFIVHFISCTSKKRINNERNTKDTTQISVEKQQIKAFWETYRTAQKYRVEGEWEEAARYYLKALEINPNHEDAWFNLGNMYLEINQNRKAEDCWQKIVEMNPKSARSHMQLGRLYLSFERTETFNIAKAKNEFLITSEINKVVTGPLILLGYVSLFEGNSEKAKYYFQSVIGTDIKSVEAHFLLGYLFWKDGNSDLALQMFEKAVLNSAPEKAVKGVLSEGDTKDGVSFLRPINESVFYTNYKDLFEIKNEELVVHLNKRYQQIDLKLKEIKKDNK